MEVTEKNCRVADKIIEILVHEKCTVEETQDILNEVTREVRRTSSVYAYIFRKIKGLQVPEKYGRYVYTLIRVIFEFILFFSRRECCRC